MSVSQENIPETTVQGADLKGSKVLFIAYFYPPTNSTGVPGSMRTVKFVRNLTNGECHVLTTPPGVRKQDNALGHIPLPVNGEHIHRTAPWDIFRLLLSVRRGLRRMIGKGSQRPSNAGNGQTVFKGSDSASASASDTEVGRLQRLKDFVYNLCYFPDQAGPWILPAFIKGRKLVRQRKLDVIFATGSPWSGLITGYLISKATGKPLIADFRDPWMNNPFHQSKGPLLDRWSSRLEEKVVRHATAISLNTEPLMEEFRQRYPAIEADTFFIMPNGIDRQEFSKVAIKAPVQSPNNEITLCHAGFLYGVRDPASLLDALRSVNQALAGTGQAVRFRQIGDISLSYDIEKKYSDLIEQGLLILDPAMPYQACLSALASADIVVNIQPGTRTQVPSKLYDYLALEKPILHITTADGALGVIVRKHGLGTQIDFSEPGAIGEYLFSKLRMKQEGASIAEDYPGKSRFMIEEITRDLARNITVMAKG